jgi:anti-sigma factor RsiW
MSTWLDAYIDLELEPQQAADLVSHARRCPRCAAAIIERQRLRSALIAGMKFHAVPPRTLETIQQAIAPSNARPAYSPAPRWAWASLAACLVLTGALVWSIVSPYQVKSDREQVVHEAVSAHIRSLMGTHLADIAASDQHVIKPWFAGKLEFAPKVVDFASDGFSLTGGRLDYVAGRPAAAVVYVRRAHVINLFSCPDPSVTANEPRSSTDRGYSAISWSETGMRHCAVSDINEDELKRFVGLARLSSGEQR